MRDLPDPDTIDIDPRPRRPMRRRPILWLGLFLLALFLGGDTALSYYVDALWFGSLGYADVFWRTLGIQGAVFAAFAVLTFTMLFGGFFALEPPRLAPGGAGAFITVNGRPVQVPVGPVLRFLAFAGSARGRARDGSRDGLGLADVRAVVVRAAVRGAAGGRGSRHRSDLRPADRVLPVHAARLAAPRRLVDDDRVPAAGAGALLRGRRGRRRPARSVRGRRVRRVPGAGPDLGAGPARARRASLAGTLRAPAGGSHHLRRRHLHRRARHDHRHRDCRDRARAGRAGRGRRRDHAALVHLAGRRRASSRRRVPASPARSRPM